MSRNIKKEREQEAYDVDEYEVILFKKKIMYNHII